MKNSTKPNKRLKSDERCVKLQTEGTPVGTPINGKMEQKQAMSHKTADEKRLNSLREMKKLYRQKVNAVQHALTNVDAKANKIIFNEDEEQETNATLKNSTTNHISKRKKALFNEEQEDDEEYNFEVKDQFQGEKGKKLMALQLKFKNDKRFQMDERFLEDTNENGDNDINDHIEVDVNVSNNDMEITPQEKQAELSILEDVLGKKIKNKDASKRKVNSIGMVRYDPTNPEHSKYVMKQNEEVKEKPSKKRKKTEPISENQEIEKPTVSKETFYEVEEDLKDALKGDASFSLRNLFNVEYENDEEQQTGTQTNNVEVSTVKTDKNPFRYDSSDNESEEITQENKVETNEIEENKESISLAPSKLWREPFFFKEDDYRFQEGIDFVRRFSVEDNRAEFKQVRRNIKEIVRAKMRNNERKNKPFRKKLGGRRLIKLKKAIKNR